MCPEINLYWRVSMNHQMWFLLSFSFSFLLLVILTFLALMVQLKTYIIKWIIWCLIFLKSHILCIQPIALTYMYINTRAHTYSILFYKCVPFFLEALAKSISSSKSARFFFLLCIRVYTQQYGDHWPKWGQGRWWLRSTYMGTYTIRRY